MDRVGAWIWRRHREHFVAVMWLLNTVGIGIALIPPSTAAGAIFLGISVAETVWWSVAVAASLAVASVIVYASLRSLIEPVRRYARGDESDPQSAWEALLRLPQMLGVRGFATVVPLSLAIALPVDRKSVV